MSRSVPAWPWAQGVDVGAGVAVGTGAMVETGFDTGVGSPPHAARTENKSMAAARFERRCMVKSVAPYEILPGVGLQVFDSSTHRGAGTPLDLCKGYVSLWAIVSFA